MCFCEHGKYISTGDGVHICVLCGKTIVYDKQKVLKRLNISKRVEKTTNREAN